MNNSLSLTANLLFTGMQKRKGWLRGFDDDEDLTFHILDEKGEMITEKV